MLFGIEAGLLLPVCKPQTPLPVFTCPTCPCLCTCSSAASKADMRSAMERDLKRAHSVASNRSLTNVSMVRGQCTCACTWTFCAPGKFRGVCDLLNLPRLARFAQNCFSIQFLRSRVLNVSGLTLGKSCAPGQVICYG